MSDFDLLPDQPGAADQVRRVGPPALIAVAALLFIVQNTESNLNNNVGVTNYRELGENVILGTDGMHSDMLRSAKAAFLTGQSQRARMAATSRCASRIGDPMHAFDRRRRRSARRPRRGWRSTS